MRRFSVFLMVLLLVEAGYAQRPRIVISSDFPPVDVIPGTLTGPPEKRSDPDDVQSMVRFLLYANEFEIAGLIAASGTLANVANKQNMLDMLDVYDRVDGRLRRHDSAYPTAASLRKATKAGLSGTYGKPWEAIIGEGKDSEASAHIVDLLEGPDSRPIWFCFWGGSQELAQALYRLKQDHHDPAEMEKIISRIRVYLIGRQDGSAQWLIDEFPEMTILLSQAAYRGFFFNAPGADRSVGDINWTDTHLRHGHGPLGALYPRSGWDHTAEGVIEGDSPSFLHLVSSLRGLNDPEKPDYGGWGGRFEKAGSGNAHWVDAPEGAASIIRWLHARQNDFAARMDRCIRKPGAVNRNPVAVLQDDRSLNILYLSAKAGSEIELDATGSGDPDGSAIDYVWSVYREAGSYPGTVQLTRQDGPKTSLQLPEDAGGTTLHVVLEVKDRGEPPLSAYRRVVITVEGEP